MPVVEVSWGELVDKLTILEIKSQRLTAPEAVANVRRELGVVTDVLRAIVQPPEFADLKQRLTAVNERLWEIEDRIRAKEAQRAFDGEFVALARSVYLNNDERSALKRDINRLLKSDLVEEKQYTRYKR